MCLHKCSFQELPYARMYTQVYMYIIFEHKHILVYMGMFTCMQILTVVTCQCVCADLHTFSLGVWLHDDINMHVYMYVNFHINKMLIKVHMSIDMQFLNTVTCQSICTCSQVSVSRCCHMSVYTCLFICSFEHFHISVLYMHGHKFEDSECA